MEKVNLHNKFKQFSDHWSPKIVGELNENYIKLAKFKGEFVWHQHEHEDELFYIVKGSLLLRFRDQDVQLEEGEFIIVPKGIEHLPIAAEEVHVLLVEPKTTLNTGNVDNDLTKQTLEKL
ncbi:MAG: cupin domain-containing protein [Gammaproteobacteria bacterium]|nr:cupin domain-containing protein [Gammaproteobacteria bacterium]